MKRKRKDPCVVCGCVWVIVTISSKIIFLNWPTMGNLIKHIVYHTRLGVNLWVHVTNNIYVCLDSWSKLICGSGMNEKKWLLLNFAMWSKIKNWLVFVLDSRGVHPKCLVPNFGMWSLEQKKNEITFKHFLLDSWLNYLCVVSCIKMFCSPKPTSPCGTRS